MTTSPDVGNEPEDPLEGSNKGWFFLGVIP